jgi:hypothetical protein
VPKHIPEGAILPENYNMEIPPGTSHPSGSRLKIKLLMLT